MPAAKPLNAANLESLGAPRLAALLLDVTAGNAAARRQLRLALAGSAGPADVARQVTRRLASLASARGFIDWRKLRPLAAEIEVQRRAILDLVAPADPAEALELAWRLAACARPVLARSNDGSGHLAAAFRAALHDLGPLAQAARPDPAVLARRVFDTLRADPHGTWDPLVEILAAPLGTAGLEALRGLAQAWHDEPARPDAPSPAPRPGQPRRTGETDDDPPPAHLASGWPRSPAADASRRRAAARVLLRRVADALGDVDGYLAQLDPAALRLPATAAALARRLATAGRLQDALAALDAAPPRPHDPAAAEWTSARIATLDALGRADDAQSLRWQHFAATLDAATLRDHLRRLPDFDDFDAEQRALAHALAHRDSHQALAFLLAWPDLPRAAQLVLARHKILAGTRHELLDPAADALDARHPLAATLLRRVMIAATLAASHAPRYRHAARHLADCASAAPRVPDFGTTPDHAAFERALRAAYPRRTAFWDAVKTSG